MASSGKESLIKDLLEKLKIEVHFPKFTDHQMKTFIGGLGENMKVTDTLTQDFKNSFLFSGSMVEGAPFARNLNPKQRKKYAEFEFDIMFPMGQIVAGHEKDIIHDLDYAKGFLWLRYEERGIQIHNKNGKQTNDFLTEHNGELYLSPTVFKEDSNLNNNIPDLGFFNKFQEELQGPSNNIDATFNLKDIAKGFKAMKKEGLNKSVQILNTCLGFLQRATIALDKFNKHIVKEFTEFEEEISSDDKNVIISQLDVDEFTCKVLPTHRENMNRLFQLHWLLIAFVNEMIWVIEMLHRTITVNELEKNVGFWKFAFLPLLSYPRTLQDSLIQYIASLFALPKALREGGYGDDPTTAIQYFLDKCIRKKPSEIETVLRTFDRCIRVIRPRFCVLQCIVYDYVDDDTVNDDLDEMNLNVDRVPAIVAHQWPSVALEYKSRQRCWPSATTMLEMFEKGCHIVPKPSNGPHRNEQLDWRWSFSQAEMLLANERSDKMNAVYLILKSMYYVFFKAVEYEEETLPSYFAKTVMMWNCEERQETWWIENSVSQCVVALLERFKAHFYHRFLPHYFIRDLNLLDNIATELLDYGTAILESICQDPLPCILDVATQLIEWQSNGKAQLSKEKPERKTAFGRGGTDEKILEQVAGLPLTIAEFRQAIKCREEKFKDIPEKQGAVNILKKLYREQIPNVWPLEYQESLAIESEYESRLGDISFTLMMNNIQNELTRTNVFRVHFQGSGMLSLEMIEKA